MVSNPHQVLGVAPGATEEEIKKAYRKKAKECHPDLHPEDPRASEKMNELNEAYDMLMHPEKYQGRQQASYEPGGGGAYYGYRPYGAQGGWQNNAQWFDFDSVFGFGGRRGESFPPPQEMDGDSLDTRRAIYAIRGRRWQEAMELLIRMPSGERNARWHYLLSLAQYGAGNTMTAQEEMQRAAQMDPGNGLYASLLSQFRQAGQAYDQRAQGFNTRAVDPSRWCMRICLINLFCNFCCRCI